MQRVEFQVIAGPNKGDRIVLEPGTCRLLGRHLSEAETAMMDRDGYRMLDANASEILTERMSQPRSRSNGSTPQRQEPLDLSTFDRGPDIIFADDAISRAHAMLFCDPVSVGIIDLASTNGTFVNDRQITAILLVHGNRITLGSSVLKVVLLSS